MQSLERPWDSLGHQLSLNGSVDFIPSQHIFNITKRSEMKNKMLTTLGSIIINLKKNEINLKRTTRSKLKKILSSSNATFREIRNKYFIHREKLSVRWLKDFLTTNKVSFFEGENYLDIFLPD